MIQICRKNAESVDFCFTWSAQWAPGGARQWPGYYRPGGGGRAAAEREDRVGSLGAIWWIRRLSWDGGQKHNAVRCPERRDNIIRNILLWIKTSYMIILCFGLESKYNDRPWSISSRCFASDFSTNDAIAAESFYISIFVASSSH